MFVIILAVTIFIVRSVAAKTCPLVDGNNEVIVQCSRKSLTDDDFTETLATLWTRNEHNEDTIKNKKLVMLVEYNALLTLKVIPSIPQIIRLSFRGNRILSVEAGTFQNLPALRFLDLSQNQLTGSSLIADVFRGKYNGSNGKYTSLPVEHLYLELNNISTLNSDVFMYLSNLKSLTLSSNPIKKINSEFEAAFLFLNHLEVLEISKTELTTLPDTLFVGNVITELYLVGNRFTEVPKCLRNIATTLRILNLNANLIQKLSATSFGGLSNLYELDVNAMHTLTRIEEHAFSPLINLKILRCSFNKYLRTIDSAAFEGLKNNWNIQELFLNNNGLRNIANDMAPWDKLIVLLMSANPWNCTCSLKWLTSFIRKRQYSDPESNLGISCKYPAEFTNRSLMYADSFLRCPIQEMLTKDTYIISYLTIINIIILIILVSVFSAVLYYIMRRIRRARILKSRYSGIFGQSVTKFKFIRLYDCDETHANPSLK